MPKSMNKHQMFLNQMASSVRMIDSLDMMFVLMQRTKDAKEFIKLAKQMASNFYAYLSVQGSHIPEDAEAMSVFATMLKEAFLEGAESMHARMQAELSGIVLQNHATENATDCGEGNRR